MQYLWVIYPKVTKGSNLGMQETYEKRRTALRKLVDSLGRGGIAHIARELGVEASYVSRALYPLGKAGRKNIGDETVVKLNEKFPGWQVEVVYQKTGENRAAIAQQPRADSLRAFPDRRRDDHPAIAEVLKLMLEMSDEGKFVLLGKAQEVATRWPQANLEKSSQ